MTEEEWEQHFIPVLRQDDDCLLFDDGNAEEAAFLDSVGNNHVWTQVEADDSIAYIPGRRKVNAIGYIVTMVPWTEADADICVEIDD
ncbi:hypothetical protein [Brevundimonas diminuta]|uniref:hypothetical protein n=1 Tax=Brevundimonas diminuta TaxID=293 RepID=UPI003D9A9878